MNTLKIIIVLVFISVTTYAQQDTQYTQYMYNTQVINPAYTGSRGSFNITALHRSQWLNVDGAPTSQTLAFNTPVSSNVGIGVSAINDNIGNGTNQNTYFNADFSYTILLSDTRKLAFGLKAGGHLLDVNLNKLRNYNPGILVDENTDIDRKFSPNFGLGIYYYTDQFYAGLSIPNLMQTEHFNATPGSNSYLVKEAMAYYAMAGYVMPIHSNLKFKPALLLKANNGAPLQIDLSANFLLNDKFLFGLAYRYDAAISALAGFQISDKFLISLAYDKETTSLGGLNTNSGSFELILRYEWIKSFKKVTAPRFF